MEEGSHKVLLVEPEPTNRKVSRTRIVTQTVGQLLWERDSGEKWGNHYKLTKTLLQLPGAEALCGGFFEPAFHGMCTKGATLTIYPMTSRKAAINYIFRNDREKDQRRDSGPEFRLETLVLNEQTGTFFDDGGNKISSLCADHYYQPITDNYPSYDSFVYDPESCQISAFWVTVAERHDFKSKGVTALYELGQRLRINNLKIRIIVAVFWDAEVTFEVPKGLIQSVCGVYTLQVTEKQLYPMLFQSTST